MTTMLEPICFNCKHSYFIEGNRLRCKAFPDKQIPDEILLGENNHSKPLDEQENNIVFEPKN